MLVDDALEAASEVAGLSLYRAVHFIVYEEVDVFHLV